jgi:hypothetical protein
MKKIFTLIIIVLITFINAQGITNTIGGNTDTDKFVIENNSGDPLLTITGAGNVGIGITDPDYKFVIKDYTSSGIIMRNNYSGNNPSDGFTISLNGIYNEAWVFNHENGPLYFGTNNQSRMMITDNGRIGINEFFPEARLHLKGDDYPNTFMFLESITNKDAGFRLIEGGDAMWHIFNNGESNSKLNIRNNAYHPCISIDQANGNVGIGTSTPEAVLEVNGRIKIGEDDSTPEAGQIKFENGHFYGYDGTLWLRLDNKII